MSAALPLRARCRMAREWMRCQGEAVPGSDVCLHHTRKASRPSCEDGHAWADRNDDAALPICERCGRDRRLA